MTAREEFNLMLNSCQHPRAVYNVLFRLVASTPPDNPRIALLEAVKEGAKKDE